jgi:hypothetical protein
MAAPSNADIMQAIGVLQGEFKGVVQRLESADDSRKVLYEKLDAQSQVIGDIGFAVKVAAEVATQAREEVKASKVEFNTALDLLNEGLKPVLAQWRTANSIGKVLIALLAAGGISLTAFVIWAGDLLTTAIRHWLGISGH